MDSISTELQRRIIKLDKEIDTECRKSGANQKWLAELRLERREAQEQLRLDRRDVQDRLDRLERERLDRASKAAASTGTPLVAAPRNGICLSC